MSSSQCQFNKVYSVFLHREEVLSCSNACYGGKKFCVLHCDKQRGFDAQAKNHFTKALKNRLKAVVPLSEKDRLFSGNLKHRIDLTGVIFPEGFFFKGVFR